MTETQGPAEARGPMTEAGRAMFQLVHEAAVKGSSVGYWNSKPIVDGILAIEDEARAAGPWGTEGLDVERLETALHGWLGINDAKQLRKATEHIAAEYERLGAS